MPPVLSTCVLVPVCAPCDFCLSASSYLAVSPVLSICLCLRIIMCPLVPCTRLVSPVLSTLCLSLLLVFSAALCLWCFIPAVCPLHFLLSLASPCAFYLSVSMCLSVFSELFTCLVSLCFLPVLCLLYFLPVLCPSCFCLSCVPCVFCRSVCLVFSADSVHVQLGLSACLYSIRPLISTCVFLALSYLSSCAPMVPSIWSPVLICFLGLL